MRQILSKLILCLFFISYAPVSQAACGLMGHWQWCLAAGCDWYQYRWVPNPFQFSVNAYSRMIAAAVDPKKMFEVIQRDDIEPIAKDVRMKLRRALAAI